MSASAVAWNKRSLLENRLESPIQNKKARYWYQLASESSSVSADDTESVYSVQDRETDVVRDTSDTRSDTTEYDIDIEYEIGSLCDDDDKDMIFFDSSDDSEDLICAAAVFGDSSLETFVTDAEDSDNSRQGDSSAGLRDYWICIQCKSQNDNPQYRFCDKCFQDRKAMFPPRPRRRKKVEKSIVKEPHVPVKLGALQTCLKQISSQDSVVSSQDFGLSSQDSGIGSSQEFASLQLDKIKVPNESKPSSSLTAEEVKNRKRQYSESSLSEFETNIPKKPRMNKNENKELKNEKCENEKNKTEDDKEKNKKQNGVICDQDKKKIQDNEEKSGEQNGVVICEQVNHERTKLEDVKGGLPELKEDCIMCNTKPKNSVFLHGRIAHMCCCYSCAMRTWKSLKRCPICKRKVSNVVRVYTT